MLNLYINLNLVERQNDVVIHFKQNNKNFSTYVAKRLYKKIKKVK